MVINTPKIYKICGFRGKKPNKILKNNFQNKRKMAMKLV